MTNKMGTVEVVILSSVAICTFAVMVYAIGLTMLIVVPAAIALSVAAERLVVYLGGKGHEDERQNRITAYASRNALYGVGVLASGMAVLAMAGLLPQYTAKDALVMTALLIAVLLSGWYVYYHVKGDAA